MATAPAVPDGTGHDDGASATARLVALALLADGRLDPMELEDLERRAAFRAMRMDRSAFGRLLRSLGQKLRCASPPGDAGAVAVAHELEAVLAGLRRPAERRTALRMVFDVIRSDGRLAPGEASLFWQLIDAWNLRLEDGTRPLRSPALRRRMARG